MHKNYDLAEFRISLPEVTLLENRCEVKLFFIGKNKEEQTQLAVLSCQLTSFKGQIFEMTMQPDLLRVDSSARVSAVGSFEKCTGFGLANAKIKVTVVDLQKKQQADVYFKRGADRKWALEDIEITQDVQIDRSALREKRRKLRKTMGDRE